MPSHLYRYRSIEAVLGRSELEGGYIYFSKPDELNDPMEGFKDLFWSGDETVWRNLLKHYMLCLLQTASYCLIAGPDFDPNVLQNIVFWAPDALPAAPIRDIYARVSATFLEEPVTRSFLSVMAARTTRVRRSELTGYLRALHPFALQIVLAEYRAKGMLPALPGGESPPAETLRKNAIAMIEGVTKIASVEFPPERVSEAVFAANEAIHEQLDLIFEVNLPDRDKQRGVLLFTRYFSRAYAAALDRLVHRDWYVACFARAADNPSMWASYGGSHRGVCLKFKTPVGQDGKPTFTINQTTSVGGSKGELRYGSSYVQHSLYEIDYSNTFPPIDFFRSLGSVRETDVNNFWYRNENGTFSTCRDDMYSDQTAWRESYWKKFIAIALSKTPDWAHEQEYRLVLHSGFDLTKSEDRCLKYKFEDLSGIVFGERTSMEDKLKIMKIIDKKCAESHRSDFEFQEVRYLHTESRFQLMQLDLLKIKHD